MATVGDLVAVDPVRLNRLSGVAEATRREVKSRARQWRDKFGLAVTGRGTTAEPARGRTARRCPTRSTAAGAAPGTRRDGARRVAAGHGPAAPRARPRPRPVRQPERAGRAAHA